MIITILLTILAVGVLILDSMGGVAIWDPSIYYFSEIPSKLDWWSAIGTMIGAVVFSLIGAIIPAAGGIIPAGAICGAYGGIAYG